MLVQYVVNTRIFPFFLGAILHSQISAFTQFLEDAIYLVPATTLLEIGYLDNPIIGLAEQIRQYAPRFPGDCLILGCNAAVEKIWVLVIMLGS